jgi:ACS family hexuronate transporter-like MFS transporter
MSNNGTSANKAWIVCGLLLLATMINYMDRLTLNQTISRIMVDFDFQKDFYGKIEGVFGLAFAVGAITTGLIVDKVSVKFLYPLMVFFWSLSGFLTGLARDKEELLYCRAALGFFEAANGPALLSPLKGFWPPPNAPWVTASYKAVQLWELLSHL